MIWHTRNTYTPYTYAWNILLLLCVYYVAHTLPHYAWASVEYYTDTRLQLHRKRTNNAYVTSEGWLLLTGCWGGSHNCAHCLRCVYIFEHNFIDMSLYSSNLRCFGIVTNNQPIYVFKLCIHFEWFYCYYAAPAIHVFYL